MFSSSKPALTLALALILGSACTLAEPTIVETTTTEAALETTTNTCSAEAPLACGTTCVDPDSNPNNCGSCGNVCASGLCYAGVCADDRAGNIFVIGHAYNTSNPALDRLIANAVATAKDTYLDALIYRGNNPRDMAFGTIEAIARGTGRIQRRTVRNTAPTSASVLTMLPTHDIFVVGAQPQATNAQLDALAREWALAIDDFLRRGGVVIVLDAPTTLNTGTSRVLGDLMPMRRATNTPGAIATVTAPESATVGAVPLMFAIGASVGYEPSGYVDSVTTESGHVMVAHRAFY